MADWAGEPDETKWVGWVARQLVSGEKRISQICREHSLCESVVRRWKLQYESSGESVWTEKAQPRVVTTTEGNDEASALAGRVKELEAALGTASTIERN